MEANSIIFDENYRMFISINKQQEKVTLVLSDDLMATEEELSESYKKKIANFVNKLDKWDTDFKNYISNWVTNEYNVDTQNKNYVLINIFILFEQSDDEIYGLEYGVDFDEEHNCGIKVTITEDGFKIFEIGTGDVAFV